MQKWETSNRRVGCAFGVAALLIGSTVGLLIGVSGSSLKSGKFSFWQNLPASMGEVLIVAAVASTISLVGLVVIAGPFWSYLHSKNRRTLLYAVSLGAILTAVAVFGVLSGGFDGRSSSLIGATSEAGVWTWKNGQLTIDGWIEAARLSAWGSLFGAILGGIMWRTAYRKTSN